MKLEGRFDKRGRPFANHPVKDAAELVIMREAGRRISSVARRARTWIRPGRTERAIAADVDAAMRAAGFDRPAFDTIVASGPHAALRPAETHFDLRVQRRYNPEGVTAYNVVPGLIGVILTMTMVMMTSLAMTRERERGTMENLLATPARPLEVMTGKMMPYILIGLIQAIRLLGAEGYPVRAGWTATG